MMWMICHPPVARNPIVPQVGLNPPVPNARASGLRTAAVLRTRTVTENVQHLLPNAAVDGLVNTFNPAELVSIVVARTNPRPSGAACRDP